MTQERNHKVIFSGPGVATLEASTPPAPGPAQLLIRTRTSLISPGTERAFFLGLPNTTNTYPQAAGYCNVGEVVAMGDQVPAEVGAASNTTSVPSMRMRSHRWSVGLYDTESPSSAPVGS